LPVDVPEKQVRSGLGLIVGRVGAGLGIV